MKYATNSFYVCLFFALCFPCLSHAQSANQNFIPISIGSDSVRLPKIVNFVDVSHNDLFSNTINKYMNHENRVLAFYITEQNYTNYTAIKKITPPYIYILTSRKMENINLSKENFILGKKSIKEGIAREGSMSEIAQKQLESIDNARKNTNQPPESKIGFSDYSLLSESDKELSYLMKAKVSIRNNTERSELDAIIVMSYLKIQGKTINVYVYTQEEDKSSIDSAKLIATSVNTLIFKLNGITP